MTIQMTQSINLLVTFAIGLLLLANLSFANPTLPLVSPAPIIRAVPQPSLHYSSIGSIDGGEGSGGDSSSMIGQCIYSILSESEAGGSIATMDCSMSTDSSIASMTSSQNSISSTTDQSLSSVTSITSSITSSISSTTSSSSSSASTSASGTNNALSSQSYLAQKAILITISIASLFAFLL